MVDSEVIDDLGDLLIIHLNNYNPLSINDHDANRKNQIRGTPPCRIRPIQ